MLVSLPQRMNRDTSTGPDRLLRFRNRVAYLGAGVLLALTTGGCPMGADLENPERFAVYGAGATGATGGTPPTAGMGGSSGSPAGGTAGATAGAAGGAVVDCSGFSCDVNEALLKSCGRTGCHSAAAKFADLQLTDCTSAAAMLNKPATHGDIDCSVPPEPFRPCEPAELPATCPPSGALLIDGTTFENSWVLKKLDPAFVPDSCGAPMPAPPGNSTAQGWSDARLACLTDFFRSLTTSQ